ncbi:hypothetical protein Ancab_028267 [Ancistrocladus abbreviatus]
MGDHLQYTFKTDNSAEIVRLIRHGEQPPAHYKLDVDSFSRLTNSLPADAYFVESTEFIVGGYRWVLQIYPHGNKKDNGDGYISIYLKLCDKLKPGSFINVIFRALIYDQQNSKYLIFQDLRERRFDATKAVWGMSKVLPHAAFYAESNGFLMQDRCTFGAEVFIINTTIPTSAKLTSIDSIRTRTHTWRVENFSKLSDDEYSPEFTIEDRTWKLNAYPRGYGAEKGKSLSLYLLLTQSNDLIAGNKLYVEYELRIKSQCNGTDRTGIFKHPFEKSSVKWGRMGFAPLRDLHTPSTGLVMDEVLLVEVCFKQMFMLKNI